MTRAGALIALGLALIVAGCASALREPPDLSEIGGSTPKPSAAATDIDALLAEAEAELARRALDPAAERARALFLEAVQAPEPRVEAFVGFMRANAWIVEHEQDSGRREDLSIEGVHVGQICWKNWPDEPECRYRLALAVGQQARERPSTAVDGLDVMVELLEALVVEAPELDSAGPSRVLALVLLRAPAWPTGPGDPEYALEHAEAAAAAFPDHPHNQLVLAEALRENWQPGEAREAYARAIETAEPLASAGDPEAAEWLEEAREALGDLGG